MRLAGLGGALPPEQCTGAEQVDDRTDVYALGVIMYQLLSSKLPFDAPAACVIMAKHITEAPPPLPELRPELPPEICQIVGEMLAKSAKERPAMTQVLRRLEQFLESEHNLASSEWRSMHRMLPRPAGKRGFPVPLLIGGLLFFMATVSLWKIGSQRRAQKAAAANPPVVTAPVVTPAGPAPSGPVVAVTAPAVKPPVVNPAPPEEVKPAVPAAGVVKKKRPEIKRRPSGPAADSGNKPPPQDIPIFR